MGLQLQAPTKNRPLIASNNKESWYSKINESYSSVRFDVIYQT
jgi:hypothetical protein